MPDPIEKKLDAPGLAVDVGRMVLDAKIKQFCRDDLASDFQRRYYALNRVHPSAPDTQRYADEWARRLIREGWTEVPKPPVVDVPDRVLSPEEMIERLTSAIERWPTHDSYDREAVDLFGLAVASLRTVVQQRNNAAAAAYFLVE